MLSILSLFFSPLMSLFTLIKSIFTFKTISKVEDMAKEAGGALHAIGTSIGTAAKYDALAEIEKADQIYGTALVKDAKSVIVLTALLGIVLFAMNWLPASAFLAMTPLQLEFCKWIEIYLGLSVPSGAALTGLNMWQRSKTVASIMDKQHEINMHHLRNTPVSDTSGSDDTTSNGE